MQNNFGDLFRRQTIVEPSRYMDGELFAREGLQHRDRDEAAISRGQLGPLPDLAIDQRVAELSEVGGPGIQVGRRQRRHIGCLRRGGWRGVGGTPGHQRRTNPYEDEQELGAPPRAGRVAAP